MAITNHERVGKGLDLLKGGLGPFVDREFKSAYKDRAAAEASRFMGEVRLNTQRPIADWDAAALLKLMWDSWNDIFRKTLGPAERSLLSELRDHRNKWAHQQTFSGDDAYRALDSAGRLLTAISAPQDDQSDLPAGGFETQFSFAQALTVREAGEELPAGYQPARVGHRRFASHASR